MLATNELWLDGHFFQLTSVTFPEQRECLTGIIIRRHESMSACHVEGASLPILSTKTAFFFEWILDNLFENKMFFKEIPVKQFFSDR